MAKVHLALGSNLGNPHANLNAAVELIGRLPETKLMRVSRYVQTAPVGGPAGQEAFQNAAAELETGLAPRVLLSFLHRIEQQLGRARRERWGPRPIDLDILLWGDERIDEPELTIPHPHMHYRRFVLEPLVEIAPEVRHPAGWTIAECWQRLNRLPHYLAITGPMGVGKTTLARKVAARLGAELVEEQFDSARLGRLYAGDRGEGVAVQQQFLQSRCELLRRERWLDPPPRWVVSDFWFAQSLAYSECLLDPAGRESHRAAAERLAADVLQPTLVVWLDATPLELAARVARRGRDFEAPLDSGFLAALRDGYARVLDAPSAPPTYRAQGRNAEELVAEIGVVAAAITG